MEKVTIKQMTRREVTSLIDARRQLPGYGDNAATWTLTDMAGWLQEQLGREVSDAQAKNFARDADIKLVPRRPVYSPRRSMDSGTKFIGNCLADLYRATGSPVPDYLNKWLSHRLTLDEAAGERASDIARANADDRDAYVARLREKFQ